MTVGVVLGTVELGNTGAIRAGGDLVRIEKGMGDS